MRRAFSSAESSASSVRAWAGRTDTSAGALATASPTANAAIRRCSPRPMTWRKVRRPASGVDDDLHPRPDRDLDLAGVLVEVPVDHVAHDPVGAPDPHPPRARLVRLAVAHR